ncbi:TPA: IS110 family transposase, partial [Candidatus Poribacteria bacterium]|nr:IS110 family transposase [Candidatus Poribacteria bacterium]
MVDPEIRVGIDVGSKTHRVGIAGPDREILEEFVISHNQEGFGLGSFSTGSNAIAGSSTSQFSSSGYGRLHYNGHGRPLDRMIQEKGYRLYNVNNLKL